MTLPTTHRHQPACFTCRKSVHAIGSTLYCLADGSIPLPCPADASDDFVSKYQAAREWSKQHYVAPSDVCDEYQEEEDESSD